MALNIINPLSYHHFINTLGGTVDAIVDLMENHQLGGWWNALQRYQFDDMDYRAGQEIRMRFHESLANANNLPQLINVSNKILDWGNMQPLTNEMEDSLQDSLNRLANENGDNLNIVYSKRIASISKIYEMWQPDKWIIYDSYCAKGLQWLVYQFWNQTGTDVNASILRFPWPPGRVGGPVDGFPILGTPNQARLGFLYSSWLCRAIAERLNANENRDITWKAYHIEMVAFQIGHEV